MKLMGEFAVFVLDSVILPDTCLFSVTFMETYCHTVAKHVKHKEVICQSSFCSLNAVPLWIHAVTLHAIAQGD